MIAICAGTGGEAERLLGAAREDQRAMCMKLGHVGLQLDGSVDRGARLLLAAALEFGKRKRVEQSGVARFPFEPGLGSLGALVPPSQLEEGVCP
jgi:hypothetical protein